LGAKGFEVSKSHNEDKVFREPVDTPFKKELLQLSCALQLRKIIIDHSEERRNFVLYFWGKKNWGLRLVHMLGEGKRKCLPPCESTVQVFSSTVLNLVRFENGFLLP